MPNTSSLSKDDRTFRERSTGTYSCILLGSDGEPITLASIDTITLTLKNISDAAVINSRNDQDVKNANNVTIHATNGTLTWQIQRADNAIVNATLENGNQEIHRAFFEYTWNGGTEADSHEVLLYVIALDDIP